MRSIIKTSGNDKEILKSNGPFRIISSDDSLFGIESLESVIINSPIIFGEEELEKEETIFESTEINISESN